MRDFLSHRAKNLKPSGIRKFFDIASSMKDVISLGVGEPDFNTPEYIINSAKKALDIGFTKYTPAAGMVELKKAVCEKFEKDNNLKYDPAQIVVSSGAKSSLYHAICAIVDDGDEVILPAPFWLTYPELIKLAGGVCVYVQTEKENGYKMTAEQFEKLTNQQLDILWYIVKFGSISPFEAFSDLGITKLSTRISEMKVLGIQFDQDFEGHENRFGKKVHFMRYRKAA